MKNPLLFLTQYERRLVIVLAMFDWMTHYNNLIHNRHDEVTYVNTTSIGKALGENFNRLYALAWNSLIKKGHVVILRDESEKPYYRLSDNMMLHVIGKFYPENSLTVKK